jgi:predicted GNAT family N-acyltransferase
LILRADMTRDDGEIHGVEIRVISAAETIPLRHAILRPGRPVETTGFPGDDEPETRHIGACRDGKLLAVASLFRVEMPGRRGVAAYQLRGMATSSEARGTGLGRLLVAAAVKFAVEKRATIVWCNARIGAAGFYRKLGFETVGDEFEIPDVGPHFRMMLELSRRPAN